MSRSQATGIDIGTHHVRVVIAERVRTSEGMRKRIIGLGVAHAKGLRYGYIVNAGDVTESIREAVLQAETMAKTRVAHAHLGIGGVGLEGIPASGSIVISRADSEITAEDVERVLAIAEENMSKQAIQNRRVIHAVPTQYKIDGKEVFGKPVGMKGLKLEVKALMITSLEQHLRDLIVAVEDAGIDVADVIAAPIAAGHVNLTKSQKVAGVVLANIGAETVSLVVYENDIPVSLKVFPIGSTDITNDIALGLKIPLEEAEEVKLSGDRQTEYSQKELEEIVVARLTDVFELIEAHLKKINRNELLPAGIVLTGGGSGIASITDLAKASLKLPSQIASLNISGSKGSVKDASWSVAYGLAMLGLTGASSTPSGMTAFRRGGGAIVNWIKQFLP